MLSIDQLEFTGSELNRPECVLATRSGHLYTADARGGVAVTYPDGRSRLLAHRTESPWLLPNGIALMPDGTFLLTHLGDISGGVFQLDGHGELTPFLEEVDGVALPPTNFVGRDHAGGIWITVSTRHHPRHQAARAGIADGFIVRVDERGARTAAEGLGYTNECAVDPARKYLYVNETFARRVSRFRLDKNGTLSGRETVTEFGPADFPDGLTFDSAGNLWVTCIISNRLIRVAPDGSQQVILEDCDHENMVIVEERYQARCLQGADFDRVQPKVLRNISSLAFGGPDLRTAWLGCLRGTSLATFRSPSAGLIPPHFDVVPTWLDRLASVPSSSS